MIFKEYWKKMKKTALFEESMERKNYGTSASGANLGHMLHVPAGMIMKRKTHPGNAIFVYKVYCLINVLLNFCCT